VVLLAVVWEGGWVEVSGTAVRGTDRLVRRVRGTRLMLGGMAAGAVAVKGGVGVGVGVGESLRGWRVSSLCEGTMCWEERRGDDLT